jgi:hypothetical protein
MALRIRRGTDAQRTGKVFETGEIVWTTDGQQLWVGDGITAGGKPVVSDKVAGYGLTYNAISKELEVSGINTDDVAEGVNRLYHTTERSVDAVGAALVAGNSTNIGITFTYSNTEDDANKINATVTYPVDSIGLTELVQDTTPELGGDLGLNGNDISGSGNINITGDIDATGDLSVNSLTTTSNIESNATITASRLILNKSLATSGITIETETGGDTDFDVFSVSSFHNDTLPSSMLFSRARGTKASPTTLLNNDFIFSLGFIGRTTNGTTGVSGFIAGSVDGTVGDGLLPGKISIRTTNSVGVPLVGLEVDSSQRTTFSGQTRFTDGTAGAPSIAFSTDGSIDTGFFHPGNGIVCVSTDGTERVRVDNDGMRVAGFIKVANVNGTLPASPEAGMIVLDGTIFRGYNGTGWVPLSA